LVAGFCEHRHRTNSYRFSIFQVDTDALRFKFQNSFRIWRIGSALKNRSALAQDQTEYRFGKKTGGKVVCPRCAPGLPAPDRLFSHFNSRSQLNRFDLGTVVERSLFRDSTSLSPLLVNDLTRQGGHSFVTILCPAPDVRLNVGLELILIMIGNVPLVARWIRQSVHIRASVLIRRH